MRKRKVNEQRILKPEEKVLWNLVTRTVSPIKHRVSGAKLDATFEEHLEQLHLEHNRPLPLTKAGLRASKAAVHTGSTIQIVPKKNMPVSASIASHIDKPVYRKIAKGKLPIDGQIDLHDLTQDKAIMRLERFLFQARNMGHRHVLVITGKGGSPTSEGVLRRMLPIWLNGPELSSIVNGYQAASRSHGGDGAFYVRLRRVK